MRLQTHPGIRLALLCLSLAFSLLNGFQLVGEPARVAERSTLPDQRRWAAAKFEGIADASGQYLDEPFISFVYNGKLSKELLPAWKLQRSSRPLDQQRIERLLTWTDPETQLQVRCVGIEYRDFPLVEWTTYFKNRAQKDSFILEKIQAIDTRLVRGPEGEFLLHYMPGSLMLKTDYQPLEATLGPGEQKFLATSGGRPCNAHMPYFNLSWSGGGAVLALGWPGQWSATFARDREMGLQITAGQELTHFCLHPGEEVRGPLIALLFYQGDWIDGQISGAAGWWPTTCRGTTGSF
jgi:alpha-galactosidase